MTDIVWNPFKDKFVPAPPASEATLRARDILKAQDMAKIAAGHLPDCEEYSVCETCDCAEIKLKARIAELETSLRGLQSSAQSKPNHAGETPREYHMHAAICEALKALKETP
jgi:hypothetical protein